MCGTGDPRGAPPRKTTTPSRKARRGENAVGTEVRGTSAFPRPSARVWKPTEAGDLASHRATGALEKRAAFTVAGGLQLRDSAGLSPASPWRAFSSLSTPLPSGGRGTSADLTHDGILFGAHSTPFVCPVKASMHVQVFSKSNKNSKEPAPFLTEAQRTQGKLWPSPANTPCSPRLCVSLYWYMQNAWGAQNCWTKPLPRATMGCRSNL